MKQVFLILLLISISCKSQKDAGSTSATELKLVLSDFYYSGEAPSFQVIREAGALKKFFIKLNKTRKPGLPVPEIDFTKEIVILYTSGQQLLDSVPYLHLLQETPAQLLMGPKPGKETSELQSPTSGTSFQLYTLPLTEKEILLVEGME